MNVSTGTASTTDILTYVQSAYSEYAQDETGAGHGKRSIIERLLGGDIVPTNYEPSKNL